MRCKRVSISTCTPGDRCYSTPWRFPGCIGCRRSPTASAVDATRPFGYRVPGSGSTPLTRPTLNPEDEGGSAARPQAAPPNACRSTVTTGKARTRLMARPSRTAQSSSRTRCRRCSWSTRPGRVWQCQRLDPHPGQALRAHPDQPLRRSRRRVSLTTSGREASTRHLPRRRTCLWAVRRFSQAHRSLRPRRRTHRGPLQLVCPQERLRWKELACSDSELEHAVSQPSSGSASPGARSPCPRHSPQLS